MEKFTGWSRCSLREEGITRLTMLLRPIPLPAHVAFITIGDGRSKWISRRGWEMICPRWGSSLVCDRLFCSGKVGNGNGSFVAYPREHWILRGTVCRPPAEVYVRVVERNTPRCGRLSAWKSEENRKPLPKRCLSFLMKPSHEFGKDKSRNDSNVVHWFIRNDSWARQVVSVRAFRS